MSISFADFHLLEPIQRALDEAGYTQPTPIQARTVPILLDGTDLIGMAQTGTGKTLAYLLPILQGLEIGGDDPQAVVVCPTRELAIQVAGEAERFGTHLGARTILAYGGTSTGEQKRVLTEGCEILVATPGRLLDFLNSAWLSFRRLRWLVLDEADRMLDMGFINDVDAILKKAPLSRQTMLFSATIPEAVRELSRRYMFHPETVRIGGRRTRVKDTVEHALYPVRFRQKADLLVEVLKKERPAKALIFTATREATSELALRLRRSGFEVVSLSSLLSQANRERALSAFRRGEFEILVATDVAARGLDITDIALVVNYDVPMQPEDYVHRIGRTGRAEREGKAITLVTEMDEDRISDIERLLEEPVPRVTLDGFPYEPIPAARRGRRPRRGAGGRRAGSGPGRRKTAANRRHGSKKTGGRGARKGRSGSGGKKK